MNWKLWSEAREIAGRHARGDGDDLAQDLMVAALERRAAVENPGAWMERVGRNAAARALSLDGISLAVPRAGRHFARTRVTVAASSAPAAVPQRKPVPKIVVSVAPPSDAPPPPQRMVFGEDLVEGSVLGPDGEIIRMMPPVAQPSLIEIRREFVPEMLKSLEDF